ncbi:MAG: hypothetical protein QOF18_705, partial [Frankiaceae bacterium]|nr:hypothetical protein [Frankiaceae bacterium]
MTERTVPFGGTAVAEPPAPMLPNGYDDESGDNANRRKLAVVGAIVGVFVLLVVAFFMLKGGSSADNAVGPVPGAHVPPATSGGTGGHAAKPVTLPKPYKAPVGRDPFKALYVAPAPKPVTSGPTGSTGVPIVGVPGVGTGTGTGTGGTTGTTGGTDAGTGAPAGYAPVWVELVSVKGSKSASFVVGYSNGKRSTTVKYANVLAPTNSLRTTFGSVFALLSVQDGTSTVQFGDG